MAGEKQSSIFELLQSKSGIGVLAICASLISSVLPNSAPFVEERPDAQVSQRTNPPEVNLPTSTQPHRYSEGAASRLWQDPFEAIVGKTWTNDYAQTSQEMLHLIESLLPEDLVILASTPDGPYSESAESRKRNRYAVISALAERHYYPVYTDAIGYLKPDDAKREMPAPIERFVNRSDCKEALCQAWVIWTPSSSFNTFISEKLPSLARRFLALGPSESEGLDKLIEEKSNASVISKSVANVVYFSTASVDSCFLGQNHSKQELDRCILYGVNRGSAQPSNLIRVGAPDNLVVDQLLEELKLRGVSREEGQHVALIADLDTPYARALTRTFEVKYQGQATGEAQSHQFNYIRGVDGRLPGSAKKDGGNEADSKQSKSESDSGKRSDGAAINDPPNGNSQRDYIRRMAKRIQALDSAIKKEQPTFGMNRKGVAAIGVLGNDVYDKLMILQALRPMFPDKLFFTTDMDAAFTTTKELRNTRNLIVASSFGLELNHAIQKHTPPFRNSEQTAYFYAALLAIDYGESQRTASSSDMSSVPKVLPQLIPVLPKTYEVGTKEVVDLGSPASVENIRREAVTKPGLWDGLDVASASQSGQDVRWEVIVTLVVLVFMLLAVLERRFLKVIYETVRELKTGYFWPKVIFAMAVALSALLCAMVSQSTNEEYFYWHNGVSIWPSEILRGLAILLSAILFGRALISIKAGRMKLAKQFGLIEPAGSSHPPKNKHLWNTIRLSFFAYWRRLCREGRPRKSVNVQRIWRVYLSRSGGSRMLLRETGVAGMLILTSLFVLIDFSGEIHAPVRGVWSYWGNLIISTVAYTAVLFFTAYIADVLRQIYIFSCELNRGVSRWPELNKSRQASGAEYLACAQKWDLPADYSAYWLDVTFIAKQTEAVGALVWYPIVGWALLLAARNPSFDNWGFPVGLIAGFVMVFAWLIHSAHYLQRSAELMRDKAIDTLNKKLYMSRIGGEDGKQERLTDKQIQQAEAMIAEIRDLKRGAFLPLYQQPWVEALLALAGSQALLSAWSGSFS